LNEPRASVKQLRRTINGDVVIKNETAEKKVGRDVQKFNDDISAFLGYFLSGLALFLVF
jgi:hypothetical protein